MENTLTLLRKLQPETLRNISLRPGELIRAMLNMGEPATSALIASMRKAESTEYAHALAYTGLADVLMRVMSIHGTLPKQYSFHGVFKVSILELFRAAGVHDRPIRSMRTGFNKLSTREMSTFFCLFMAWIAPERQRDIEALQLEQYIY